MATLYKKPNSAFYYAQYFNADGKRVSKSTGTTSKREATRTAAGYEAEARDARNQKGELPKAFAAILESAARDAAAGNLTLARTEELLQRLHRLANPDFRETSLEDFWQAWIREQQRHVGESTAGGYADDLAIFAPALGKRVMSAAVGMLTTDQINSAIDKLKKTGDRRASTINKALSSLRRVMEFAVVKKMATSNPAKQSRSLQQSDSEKKAPFTVPEIRRMLDHEKTTDEWRGAIIFGAHTSLRMDDISILNRKHIDGNRVVIMPSKTSKSQTIVQATLSPSCLKWLGDRQGDRDGNFFPNLKTTAKPTRSMQFSAIMARAEVPREIELPGGLKRVRSFHALRHTQISALANADVAKDVRMKLSGHKSSAMHDVYSHHDEALDRAVALLPEL